MRLDTHHHYTAAGSGLVWWLMMTTGLAVMAATWPGCL